jgi:hypothetical protein
VVVLFFGLGLHRQLTLEALQQAHGALVERRRQSPLLVGGAYMGIYVLVAALSLPGAAVLTLAGGALFGLGLGTLLVSTRGRRVCMTCHWFRHHAGGGIPVLTCQLHRGQIAHGEHLTSRCPGWIDDRVRQRTAGIA